jgi:hypothetical protein
MRTIRKIRGEIPTNLVETLQEPVEFLNTKLLDGQKHKSVYEPYRTIKGSYMIPISTKRLAVSAMNRYNIWEGLHQNLGNTKGATTHEISNPKSIPS